MIKYLAVNVAKVLTIEIPESASGNTVTYEIINPATNAVLASGNMTFSRDEWWKVTYTPTATGTIILKVNNTTIDSKRSNEYEVVGSVTSPDGVTTSDLTSLAHLREYLKKETADTEDDTFLQDIITRMSADIEKKCGRTFIATTHTEYYKGDGKDRLLTRQFPINSVTSIHVDEDRLWASDTALDSDDITISDDVPGLIILNGDYFDLSNVENVKVVYNAGYATIPYDLESACIKLCAIEYIEARRLNASIKGERDLQSEKKELWKLLLNNYKSAIA